jgi:oligo-alginate lyase
MSWPSVEFTDGPDGKHGGLGILRSGTGADQSMLLMKYGVHGEGHGHFDKLHFIFFDGGREVVPDYGFSRWINIEPKFGGRYLPENDSYAMQTIAHNTVVVDETTQNRANFDEAEKLSGQRRWFDASNPFVQGMSASATGYYPGVDLQRTMFLIRDARLPYPVVVDLFKVTSAQQHTYDLPLHFRGQLIATSATYMADTTSRTQLGKDFGYQHIWKEASAKGPTPLSMTWLDGNRYYTITTTPHPTNEVIFGRTGAADPNFNLIVEPMMIVRRQGTNVNFASVIEPHGYFNEAQERSIQARPMITQIRTLASNDEATVLRISGNGIVWTVMVAHGTPSTTAKHTISGTGLTFEWTGNFAVEGVKNGN